MQQSMKMALFGALTVMMAGNALANEHHHNETTTAVESSQQQLITASGVIKDVDLTNKKITIDHQAIPAIGWPAMTMRFTFASADDNIKNLKPGSHVNFSFIQQNNISLLQEITTTSL